jgi:hypothetical protein
VRESLGIILSIVEWKHVMYRSEIVPEIFLDAARHVHACRAASGQRHELGGHDHWPLRFREIGIEDLAGVHDNAPLPVSFNQPDFEARFGETRQGPNGAVPRHASKFVCIPLQVFVESMDWIALVERNDLGDATRGRGTVPPTRETIEHI